MRRQQGFTLVELIVVIVVLGILAATALPRFINVSTEARAAAVQGMAGSLRSAAALVQAKWIAAASSASTSVTMADATSVTVGNSGATAGIPTATGTNTGITAAVKCESATACQGFTVTQSAGVATFRPTNAAAVPASCQVAYDSANGTVTVTVTACN